jgi:hypothetical protein
MQPSPNAILVGVIDGKALPGKRPSKGWPARLKPCAAFNGGDRVIWQQGGSHALA